MTALTIGDFALRVRDLARRGAAPTYSHRHGDKKRLSTGKECAVAG